jgi:hypothetical protein
VSLVFADNITLHPMPDDASSAYVDANSNSGINIAHHHRAKSAAVRYIVNGAQDRLN